MVGLLTQRGKTPLIDTLDDGATFLDEAPETPAPLFAVRAFKTAIFGTPRSIEHPTKRIEEQQPREQKPIRNDAKMGPEPLRTTQQKGIGPTKTLMQIQENLLPPESTENLKLDQLASPTKGILLTPGTAATRRKTVSFSAKKEFRERTNSPDNAVELDSKESRKESLGHGLASEPQRKQSALTRTFIELSTKRSSSPAVITGSIGPDTRSLSSNAIADDKAKIPFKTSESVVDATVDLSQPRSRSGQHWKAEYEEYHKNSSREMKKIIQYGQNIKSYAAKKDCEATSLNEKLQKELGKVARMESKVSKLAKQLKTANAQGPEGESEQARIVGELAQQTAMTVRYQRKAERYRKAMRRQSANNLMENESQVPDESLVDGRESPQVMFEVATLQAQLESLQETATVAEKRAAKLENENKQLKRSLARVKEEMMSYESRRQVREGRLEKREERHRASKEQCEAELANMKVEYQRLLQTNRVHGNSLQQPVAAVKNVLIANKGNPSANNQDTKEGGAPPPVTIQNQPRQPSLSPRKRRSLKHAVDIWTLSTSNDNPKQSSPNREATELAPSSVKHDIRRALNEIDQNLIASKPDPSSQTAADPKVPTHIETILPVAESSPKRDIADDLMKVPTFHQLHQSTVGRSASLLSHRIGSRTSTMGSARISSMSAERAAAAKARLAERKKSGEKKKKKQEDRVENLGRGDVV